MKGNWLLATPSFMFPQSSRPTLEILNDMEPVCFLVSCVYHFVLLYIEHFDAALDEAMLNVILNI